MGLCQKSSILTDKLSQLIWGMEMVFLWAFLRKMEFVIFNSLFEILFIFLS